MIKGPFPEGFWDKLDKIDDKIVGILYVILIISGLIWFFYHL